MPHSAAAAYKPLTESEFNEGYERPSGAEIIEIEGQKGGWTFMPQMRRATFEQANLMLEGMEVTQSLDMGAYIMHTGRHWQLGRTVLIIGANEDCAIISRAVAAPVEVKDVAERVTLRLC